MSGGTDEPDFLERRVAARKAVNALDQEHSAVSPERSGFFESVYEVADGDGAKVPWADLKPKDELVQWLAGKSGIGLQALDVACGLGDHAELLAKHEFATTAFDVSQNAIDWARKRFANSQADYAVADLFNPPQDWLGRFDLVWECYTIQALHPDLREKTSKAIAEFVRPGGTLLVYTRSRKPAESFDGPPWPLSDDDSNIFATLGFELIADKHFDFQRPDKVIPHRFSEWRRMQ